MLKGLVQDHFYNNQLSSRTLEEACTNLRNFFEGPGYHCRNLDEWNSITLASTIVKNPKKTIYENIQLLINKLRQLQYSLPPALRNTKFLYNKLVIICQGSPIYRYIVLDPPTNLGSLINKLQSSITSYEKEQESTKTFFIDYYYYSQSTTSRFSNQRSTNNQYNYNDNQNGILYWQYRRCFIYKREDYRLWKHT